MKLLVDGDILTFRAAFSAENEDEAWVACARASDILREMLIATEAETYEVWLSGKDNFRHQIYPEYKANRKDQKRPKWEHEVKDYLVRSHDALWSSGCEADDMLGVRQHELSFNSCIATIDKDLDMIPGNHYNFVKKHGYVVTDKEALNFFLSQLIIGDPVDNIKGVVGSGKSVVRRLKVQEALNIDVISALYGSEEELEMNARCLWIWRKMNDNWRDWFE